MLPSPQVADVEANKKRCILLAEDDPSLLRLLDETLKEAGFEVVIAPNGEAALKRARNHPDVIDLLITDIDMPKLDGFDLQERLRRERPEVKLLVISGNMDSNITGADFPYLRKPFLPSELVARVSNLLNAGPEE